MNLDLTLRDGFNSADLAQSVLKANLATAQASVNNNPPSVSGFKVPEKSLVTLGLITAVALGVFSSIPTALFTFLGTYLFTATLQLVEEKWNAPEDKKNQGQSHVQAWQVNEFCKNFFDGLPKVSKNVQTSSKQNEKLDLIKSSDGYHLIQKENNGLKMKTYRPDQVSD